MPAPAGLWSDWAIPQLLPHRVRKSRSARARHGTGNTAVPAPPGATVQAARLPERVVRVVAVLLPLSFLKSQTRAVAGRDHYCLTICLTFINSLFRPYVPSWL